jgi:hypothetical protein
MSSQKNGTNNRRENSKQEDGTVVVMPIDPPWNSSLRTVIEVITCGVATGISCSLLYHRLTGHKLSAEITCVLTATTTSIYIYLREQNLLTARNVRNISLSASMAALLFELNHYIHDVTKQESDSETELNQRFLPSEQENGQNTFRRLITRMLSAGDGGRRVYMPGRLHSRAIADSSHAIRRDIAENGVTRLIPAVTIAAAQSDNILKGDVAQPTNTVGIDGQVTPAPVVNPGNAIVPFVPVPQSPPVQSTIQAVSEQIVSMSPPGQASNVIGDEASTLATLQTVENNVSSMISENPNYQSDSMQQEGGAKDGDQVFQDWW